MAALAQEKARSPFCNGLISGSLFKLRENIDRLRTMEQSLRDSLNDFLIKYIDLSKTENDVSVNNLDLSLPLTLADCHQNIVSLSVALTKALDGDKNMLSNLILKPILPFPSEVEKVEKETATTDEIIRWVNEL